MVQRLKFFVEQWFVASSIRGDSWFDSNQPVTFELKSNRNRPIRIWIKSRSFAGPYWKCSSTKRTRISYNGYYCLFLVAAVDSSSVACGMKASETAERCLDPFQDHLEKGVAALAPLNDRDLAEVCRWLSCYIRVINAVIFSLKQFCSVINNELNCENTIISLIWTYYILF